jgi:glucose/arabinose dehydrogenase
VSKSRVLRAVLACISLMPLGVAGAGSSQPAAAAPTPSAVTVPSGYTDLVVGDAPSPTAISKTATGELLVTSQSGELWSFAPNGARTQLISFADICPTGERGLLGVTNDVGLPGGSYVYLYATRKVGPGGACTNRVSRFPWNASGLTLASEEVLLDNILSFAGNHNGGDIALGKDGNIYVGIGDSGCHPNGSGCAGANSAATDNGWLLGKIARITRTGGVPADNPFIGPGTVRCNTGGTAGGPTCQEIFAYGLRNPFRMAFDPAAATTTFNINDVGQNAWEEIDAGVAGANYGWNLREGPCASGSTTNCGTVAGLTNPIYAYPHSEGCKSITGGAFAPATWSLASGSYFYSDFICKKIFQLTPNGSGGFTRATFADEVGSIVDLKNFGDGSLYYSTYANGGQIHRITRDVPPEPPKPSPGRFVPLSPTRIMDTRNGLGFPSGNVVGGGTVSLAFPSSVVPSSAVAVAANVTVADNTSAGFLTLWPTGTTKPATSSVNFAARETVANSAVVAVGPNAAMNISASATTHVIVDVTGYWEPVATATSGRFVALTEPTRVADSRSGLGVPAGKVAAGGTVDVAVRAAADPGATAVAITVTSANAGASGFVTVWPTGATRPNASTLNPNGAGDVRANLVMLPIGTGKKISVYSSVSTDVIVDVVGYFTDSSATNDSAGLMQIVPLSRLVDTRGSARQAANATVSYGVAGSVAAPSAVLYNLTATATGASGYLTAFPTDRTPPPLASNVNASAAGQSRAALSLTRLPVSAAPTIKVFSSMATDVIIDLAAYFLSAAVPPGTA